MSSPRQTYATMNSPPQTYSTLETYDNSHSNLEPVYNSPDYPAKPFDGAERYNVEDKTAYAATVGVQNLPSTPHDAEGGEDHTHDKKRRVCGMPVKIAIIVGVILFLVIVGAVLGGVLGTQLKKDPSTSQPTPPIEVPFFECPSFEEDTKWIRSDYWYAVGQRAHRQPVYLKGLFDHATNSSSVTTVGSFTYSEAITELQWQFQKLDDDPLGALGCNDTVDPPRRLYKLACRLQDTEQDVSIRLSLDLRDWSRISSSQNLTAEKPRLRLTHKDDADLSQIWYVDRKGSDTFVWYEIHNYLAGEEWVLAARWTDSEPWMSWGTAGNDTMWGKNQTKEWIKAPWFGF